MSELTQSSVNWLTVDECAATLRIAKSSIYRAISGGQLRAKKVNARGDLRVARTWLEDWCNAGDGTSRRDASDPASALA